MTIISTLPPAPQPTDDKATFNAKAFAMLAALPTFVTEANTQAGENNTAAGTATAKAADAATSAAAAAGAQAAAAASAGAVPWVGGTVYATGARVVSGLNGQVYRRTSASGSGAVDPSQDFANYARVYAEPEMVTAESFFF